MQNEVTVAQSTVEVIQSAFQVMQKGVAVVQSALQAIQSVVQVIRRVIEMKQGAFGVLHYKPCGNKRDVVSFFEKEVFGWKRLLVIFAMQL